MTCQIYGYVRVSTKDQNEDRQMIAMLEFPVPEKNIVVEKQSGKDFIRPRYRRLIRKMKKGDLLVVADLDKIKASGRETITPMIICNSDAYEQVETFTGKDVEITDAVMKLHPAK